MLHDEYEIKLMLEKSEYLKLAEMSDKSFYQTNYYFDTKKSDLYDKGYTLRIREKDSAYEITLKDDFKYEKPEVIASREKNIPLNETDFQKIIRGEMLINEFIKEIKDDLIYVGNLKTKRSLIEFNDLPVMELDMNEYLGITDYELEWEIENSMYNEAMKILDDLLSNSQRVKGKGKYLRFKSVKKSPPKDIGGLLR